MLTYDNLISYSENVWNIYFISFCGLTDFFHIIFNYKTNNFPSNIHGRAKSRSIFMDLDELPLLFHYLNGQIKINHKADNIFMVNVSKSINS